MKSILIGTADQLGPNLMAALSLYRHRVFVQKLRWNIVDNNGSELDQFDHASTIYLLARNGFGEIGGTARLLPTTGEYLLERVFPDLLDGARIPSSSMAWEISRFAAVDFTLPLVAAPVQCRTKSRVSVSLLREALAEIARQGGTHAITVSPVAIERLLRTSGFSARRLGSARPIDNRSVAAYRIECS